MRDKCAALPGRYPTKSTLLHKNYRLMPKLPFPKLPLLIVTAVAMFSAGCGKPREDTTEARHLPGDNPFSDYPDLAALMESGTYYNDASSVAVRFATGAKPTNADLDEMLADLRKARDLAETIDANKLEAVYPSLGRSFNELYLPGLRLRVDAMENPRNGRMQEANVLLEQWDAWYRENAEAFKARLREIGIPV
jgi:hypothetical protein